MNFPDEKYEERQTLIYKIALSVYLSTLVLSTTMFGQMVIFASIIQWMRYFSYALFAWKIISCRRYTSAQLIKYAVVLCAVLAVVVCSGISGFLFLYMIMIAGCDVKLRDIVKTACVTVSACCIVTVLADMCGLIVGRVFDNGNRVRYSMGFESATTASNYFFYITLMVVYLKGKSLKLAQAVLMEIIAVFLYCMTDTRSAFFMTGAVLVLAMWFKVWEWRGRSRIFEFLIKNITLLGMILMGTLTYLYTRFPVFDEVNSLVSNRLRLTARGIETYGIHLFGNVIEWVGASNSFEVEDKVYNFVDSSYFSILLQYGAVTIILLLIGYHMLGKLIVEEKEWYLGLVIICEAAHATFDPQFLMVNYNIFLLALGYLFVSDRDERKRCISSDNITDREVLENESQFGISESEIVNGI